jgi:hypothetical protein
MPWPQLSALYPARNRYGGDALRCWVLECDVDPLILQARWLHHQGQHHDATAVEEELHPVF